MSCDDGKDLAIVIVSFNVCQHLQRCLASVMDEASRLTDWNTAIWVVDNASTDGSPDMVRSSFPQVQMIANGENLGFARANNQALRALGFNQQSTPECLPRFVALLNPDTTLAGGALASWLQAGQTHPRAGVIGTRLSYPDGGFQHSAFRFPNLAQVLLDFWPLHHRLIHSRLNGRYPRLLYDRGIPFPIDHPLGAAMLLRREALEDVGPLDEGYFIYAEEIDWCLRLHAAGWEAICAPAVGVIHHEAQSTRQFRDAMFVALWRSRLRLFARHYRRPFNAWVRVLIRLGLKELAREARTAFARGELEEPALGRRLAAFQEVADLTRLRPQDFL